MKKVINCNTDHNPVINKMQDKVSVERGEEIAAELFEVLNYRKDGIGLAAPQLGIDAAVAVVNVKKPLYLINPRIVKQWDEITYKEACLSYPGKSDYTKRFKYCIVEDDAHEEQLYFGPEFKPNHETGEDEGDPDGTLESVCVQHEIDHLNGRLCLHNIKRIPIRVTKYGRNDKVLIEKDGQELEMKWKKAQVKVEKEGWKIK